MQPMIGGGWNRDQVCMTLETTLFTTKLCRSNVGEGCLFKDEYTNLDQVEPWWRIYLRPGQSGPLAPFSCFLSMGRGDDEGWGDVVILDPYSWYIMLWRTRLAISQLKLSRKAFAFLSQLWLSHLPPVNQSPRPRYMVLWLARLSHMLPVGVEDGITWVMRSENTRWSLSGQLGCHAQK